MNKINRKVWRNSFDKKNVLVLRGKREKFIGVDVDNSNMLKKIIKEVDKLLGGNLREMKSYNSLSSLFN